MPREEVVKWGLQEGKDGYVPSQSHRRDNTGVLEDIRFLSNQITYDTLSEGKRNNNNNNNNNNSNDSKWVTSHLEIVWGKCRNTI